MLRMTFTEYDHICELLESLTPPAAGWLPSKEDLTRYGENPNPGQMLFFIWLSEFSPPPETDEEKEKKKELNRYLRTHLELTEEKEETTCD